MVSRDALNFGVIQTFVAVLLVVGLVGLGAVTGRKPPETRSKAERTIMLLD